jgi:elongation factor Ts
MAVTAKEVSELRKRTGLGMMECKKLLTEVEGDMDAAIDKARKMGVKSKVAERAAGEGRVGSKTSGNKAAAVEVLCNTDFTANSDPVAKIIDTALEKLLAGHDAAAVAEDAEIKDLLVAAGQQTGENVVLGRGVVVEGDVVSNYQYTVTNKVAALIALTGGDDELARQIGLHLVAHQPVALGLTRDDVPADLVAKERELAVEQAKATGKPQEIAEKIAEGKMGAFFKTAALLDQEFINPDVHNGTVGELLKKKGATLKHHARLAIGG